MADVSTRCVEDFQRNPCGGDTLGYGVHHVFRVAVHRAVDESDSRLSGAGGVLSPLFVEVHDELGVLPPDEAVGWSYDVYGHIG
ncbi:hypothetical protein [Candidatus Hakubella thermalkaliphila]|uniref:hypothetical protein n=1 Tax=Candidatus Hakubella thermalkaliphila TaxID=2754717 RepID=UPI00215955C0|nr:hypothetical protein [Candidatus Hakubella thermalkaliphila]